MGNFIGNISKKALKPFKNYNLESRTQKVLIKNKVTPAPRHENTVVPLLKLANEQQDKLKKEIFESNPKLLERLQQVYVTSTDSQPLDDTTKSSKSMPVNREYIEEPFYGYHEPKRIPFGKLTLKAAMDLMSKHQEDSEKWDVHVLAKEFKLDAAKTEQLVKYFRTFTLVIPTPVKEMDKPQRDVPIKLIGAHTVIRLPKEDKNPTPVTNPTMSGS